MIMGLGDVIGFKGRIIAIICNNYISIQDYEDKLICMARTKFLLKHKLPKVNLGKPDGESQDSFVGFLLK